MAKTTQDISVIESSLNKEKMILSKLEISHKSLHKQRKFLKNEAKIVSLSEYKVIVKEIVENITSMKKTVEKINELSIRYENSKKNKKS